MSEETHLKNRAIALLSSMVRGGEQHSETSEKMVRNALDAEPEKSTCTWTHPGDEQTFLSGCSTEPFQLEHGCELYKYCPFCGDRIEVEDTSE